VHDSSPSPSKKVLSNRQLMPDIMVLVDMLIWGNYNKVRHNKARKQIKKPPPIERLREWRAGARCKIIYN
jgi:hypothetical protein